MRLQLVAEHPANKEADEKEQEEKCKKEDEDRDEPWERIAAKS